MHVWMNKKVMKQKKRMKGELGEGATKRTLYNVYNAIAKCRKESAIMP